MMTTNLFQMVRGGKTNISYNCLDRPLDGPNRDKAAIIWEGEPGGRKHLPMPKCTALSIVS